MIYIFVASIFGLICSVIASSRKRSWIGWFVIGFLFPLIGLILAIVLPPPASFDDTIDYMPEPGPLQFQQQQFSANRAKQDNALAALEKIAALKDRGVISEAEFEEKKAELLASV